MKTRFGIRREDINRWEKRVPLIPSHARELAERHPIEFRIQPSDIRVFTDDDYRLSGVPVEEGLSPCPIVLALKEIPIELIERGKTYLFFSHTAKGQSQNMPMLKRMMDLGCSIIDYEKMADEQGRRVLYFGNYAGHAGMIDTIWALGKRLQAEGIPNPFTLLEPTHRYRNLVEAKEAVGRLAWKLVKQGPPPELGGPIVFGFFGYGHVAQGAQEVFDILPVETVRPADIPRLFEDRDRAHRNLYKAVFREEDMVRPIRAGQAFDLQDYYRNPQGYRAVTEDLVPYLTAVVNGIYWTPKFPKYITKPFLKRLYAGAQPRLRVVGDISCDINGSIECTVKATDSENPVYVYDPIEDKAVTGFAGRGPAVLAVYNLPAELPLESSTYFSGKLKEHIPALAACRFDRPLAECGLPDVLRRACILYRGELTPDFAYLGEYVA